MSIRVPSPNSINYDTEEITLDIPQERVQKYECGFSSFLLNYIKNNELLRNFYLRLIYECEVAQRVMKVSNKIHIRILSDLIDKLTQASSLEEIAIYDSEFHKSLFAIAGEEDFFNWWTLQSKDLQSYLKNFWNCIGYKTTSYYQLISIHRQILNAIIKKDESEIINEMEKHFSILLFQLLGTVYRENSNFDNW